MISFTTNDIGRNLLLVINNPVQYEVLNNLWRDVWKHTTFIKEIFQVDTSFDPARGLGIIFQVDTSKTQEGDTILILRYMHTYKIYDAYAHIIMDKQNYTQASFREIIDSLVLHKQYEFYKRS